MSSNADPPAHAAPTGELRVAHVGVDVFDVHEVEHSVSDFKERYLMRVFNDEEVEHALLYHAHAASFLAGRFAAREAVVKLLKLENARAPWALVSIQGHPGATVELHCEALARAAELGITEILLSIDYGRKFATALAVADVTTNRGG